MTLPPLRLLIVENSSSDAALVLREFEIARRPVEHQRVETEPALRQALLERDWDAVIADFSMPRFDAVRALEVVQELRPDLPFLLVSGSVPDQAAVDLMRAGAQDYLVKDNLSRLVPATERSIAAAEIRRRQRAVEQALRENEERFRQLTETIDEVFWLWDADAHRTIYVSPAYERIWGRSCASAIEVPLSWLEAVHPEDRDRVREANAAQLQTGHYDEDYRVIQPNGAVRWIRDRAFVVRGESGRVRRIAGIAEDITERRKAREEARQRATYQEAVAGLSVAALRGHDLDALFADVVLRVAQVLGVELAHVIEFLPDSQLRLRAGHGCKPGVPGPVLAGPALPAETVIIHHDHGAESAVPAAGWLRDHGIHGGLSVLIGGKEASWGILGAHTTRPREFDPLELKFLQSVATVLAHAIRESRAEQALRQSESHLRALFEHLPLRVFLKDRESRFISVNHLLARDLNVPAEQVVGKSDSDFFPAALAEKYRADDREVMDSGQTKDFEEQNVVDGKERWVHVVKVPYRDADGAIVGLLGIFEDISAHRSLEAQLRQSQKLEAIGQLAGGVAHDFNNILGAVIMQTDLLDGEPSMTPPIREGVSEIRGLAKRAADLTRQLLLFSRREVMQLRHLDLNETVTNLAKMLQRLIGEHIQLSLELHSRPLPVHADPGMIDQVLMNLSVNARDAMPESGHLRVRTDEVSLTPAEASRFTEAQPGRFACLKVTDSGSGIPPEVLSRIFEPFFTTKETGKGTGLGLATVFGIVKQHGGWLDVTSEVGQGSAFSIFLPLDPSGKVDAGVKPPEPARPRGGPETILFVEDEEDLRSMATQLIERFGYRVLPAKDGPEALAVWGQHQSDIRLLLSDMVLPGGMTGQDLAQRLRAESPGLKVIYTSGYTEEFAGRGLSLHPDETFLPKPYLPDQLLATIRKCLDKAS